MKHLYLLLIAMLMAFLPAASSAQEIIIDHNCIDITQIPYSYIEKAQQDFRLAYGHTSHGSQLISGATLVMQVFPGQYAFTTGSDDDALYIRDRYPSGDLGNPDRESWAQRTRDMLNNNTYDVNMVMWSWCGQASSATEEQMATYLNLMNQLEEDFPDITFIYMTGHLDGTGVDGNLNVRDNQIRTFCRENDKILFDFADIESYDPDGNYYLDKRANDGCYYYEGSTRRNWAEEWCAANPDDCHTCSCAHSHGLNCWMKGQAFWWMMARIAGWDGTGSAGPDVSFTLSAESFSDTELMGQSEITIEIENTGSEDIEIEMGIDCEDENIFAISDMFSFPMSLTGGETAIVPIFFAPKDEKHYTATVNIYVNGAETPYQYDISGRGIPLDVEDAPADFNCFVVPNPVTSSAGYLYLNNAKAEQGEYQIKIINLPGKLIHDETVLASGQARVNLAELNLPAGMYYISVSRGPQIVTLPLIVR